MKKNKNVRRFNPFPLERIYRLKLLGYFVIMLGPLLFYYKSPDNSPFSVFIEFLLILFGLVILKDCWISQAYWQNKADKTGNTPK